MYQEYPVLQGLFSFLNFETQVFPEPSCSNTYGGFLLLSINLSCMEVEPKVWRLYLSFHEASEAACRSFSQAINSKAPAHTIPLKQMSLSTVPWQWSACHTHTWSCLEACLPAQEYGTCWDVAVLWFLWLPGKTELQNFICFSMFSWGQPLMHRFRNITRYWVHKCLILNLPSAKERSWYYLFYLQCFGEKEHYWKGTRLFQWQAGKEWKS